MFSMPQPRRIAALVLPHLLCEVAAQARPESPSANDLPRGVVLLEPAETVTVQRLSPNRRLDAVNGPARKLGLCPGLSITEACAFVAHLQLDLVWPEQVHQALARLADLALGFGPTVALAPPNALHVDLTGALRRGEETVAQELQRRASQLGHAVRLAVASGPNIAVAVARHGRQPLALVPAGQELAALYALPVSALPIHEDDAAWFLRLGLVTVGDLARLPRKQLVARLGDRAPQVIGLLLGRDPAPLKAYEPPETLEEQISWEDGIEQQQALLFIARRLTDRLAARLEGRALAANSLHLTLEHDRSVARLREVAPVAELAMPLPAPLSHAEDLLRTVRARLENIELLAPVVGMRVQVPHLTQARRVQLDLSRDVTTSPDALPLLLAELAAEIGEDHMGTLQVVDSLRPEARSKLARIDDPNSRPKPSQTGIELGAAITRLLPKAQRLGRARLTPGQELSAPELGRCTIGSVALDNRLEAVEWWTPDPVHRDYVRVWLEGWTTRGTAWVYVDRASGQLFLHGWQE